MEKISHREIRSMFIGAYSEINKNKEEINKINMFPVPDQDTGNNFEKTLAGIYEVIKNKQFKNLKQLSEAIIDGALNTASGNVGVIYVSFLSGFLPSLKKENIDIKDLIVAFQNGAEKARKAIQEPKEGTILDVIDATAKTFGKEAKKNNDIVEVLKKTISQANQAVKDTQKKMELYQKAFVVDAGGLGFAISLQGFLDGLMDKQESIFFNEDHEGKTQHFIQILDNRFEVMALIKKPKLTREKIREQLKKMGNCLDIVSANEKIKIHIHTDFPDEVVQILEPLGEVLQMITTDMTKMVGEKHFDREAIGLVVDEAANLPEDLIKKEDIFVVPFGLFLDEKQGVLLNTNNVYQTMREIDKKNLNVWPKTSQPSPGKFLQAYKQQLTKFSQIVCIPMSSFLSGSFNSAMQARELLPKKERERVYVIDSLCGAGAQGLLAMKVIMMKKRSSSFDQIVNQIKEDRKKVFIIALAETSKWLEKGGRINHNLATIFEGLLKLKIRPLIGLKNFKISLIGFKFGFGPAVDSLFLEFKKRTEKALKNGKNVRVFITHNDDKKTAEILKQKINDFGVNIEAVVQTTAALGIHTGPGVIICSYMID